MDSSTTTTAPRGRKIIPVVDVSNETALFAKHVKIHPRTVQRGWFDGWRWALVWITQLLYYGAPWLRWNERQAVLFDLAARKFYIFGLVLWPQDFIYLAGLLIISAYALFLFTAIGGRLFCGYACPQTVYTEIFMWIERKIEGERNARIKLDQAPLSAHKLARKSLKMAAWIAVSLWTGFTFVAYFVPIIGLGHDALAWNIGGWALFWMLFYAGFTLLQAGFLREQVCKYMCPYARFQSAMFDPDTLIVTYDTERGEPRGARAKKVDFKEKGLGACVDCSICVQVCPTGIDIREGLQYECIGCGACIDGCNEVMDKMGYERGLIRYTTETALQRKFSRREIWQRVMRPRTLIYGVGLLLIVSAWSMLLLTRNPLKVDVIRDRGVLAREVAGDKLENVYQLRIMNTDEHPHRYRIAVSGLPQITIPSAKTLDVPAASTRTLVLGVDLPMHAASAGSHPFTVSIESEDGQQQRHEQAVFYVPQH